MRVGIFCTALWVVAIFGYASWNHFYQQNIYPRTVLETCMQYAPNTSRCEALLAQTKQEWKRIPFDRTQITIIAFGPLPLFWALGWLVAVRARRPSNGTR
jgi:hypothetical protein